MHMERRSRKVNLALYYNGENLATLKKSLKLLLAGKVVPVDACKRGS